MGTAYQFTIEDTTPPEVVYQSPLAGAIDVTPYPMIVLVFNEAIQIGTGVTASLTTITGGANVNWLTTAAEVDVKERNLTLQSPIVLSSGHVYTADIPAGFVTDVATVPNSIDAVNWTFQPVNPDFASHACTIGLPLD